MERSYLRIDVEVLGLDELRDYGHAVVRYSPVNGQAVIVVTASCKLRVRLVRSNISGTVEWAADARTYVQQGLNGGSCARRQQGEAMSGATAIAYFCLRDKPHGWRILTGLLLPWRAAGTDTAR